MTHEDDWDEGDLGRNPDFVVLADPSVENALDEALGLKSITVRIPKQDFEVVERKAKEEGITPQALTKRLITAFVFENSK